MKVNLTPEMIAQLDGSVMRMIGVATELTAVAEEENRRIEAGGKAEIEDLLLRKRELVGEYEKWIKAMAQQQQVLMHANPTLFSELLDCNRTLSKALAENKEVLKKAMTVNKRRVEVIMQAIRAESAAPTAYAKNGRFTAHSIYSTSLRPAREI
ncbi:hypothetical protein [Roseibium aestuarii]|uniref:Flagellar protein FlgN n=1 Tax=Roseibium aestuarii TaxID=2600299 RepID=A0ABW4K2T7_9HYPH|nr:hypothetical protein [Roseibium aestuarii]